MTDSAPHLNHKSRAMLQKLTNGRAPRDLRWADFVSLWEDLADSVETESGDRVVVEYAGRRLVFRRPNDDLVSIDQVEQAREALRDDHEATDDTDDGTDTLIAVAVENTGARILTFDLGAASTEDTAVDVANPDPKARRMRTVERRDGRDDKQTLDRFFDELAAELVTTGRGAPFVLLGHGSGTSDTAASFGEWLGSHKPQLAQRVRATVSVDLKGATDADLEARARAAVGRAR